MNRISEAASDDRASPRLRLANIGALERWKLALPVIFVLGSLLALVALPIASNRRSALLRQETREIVEPAARSASRIQIAILREQAAIFGYQVTRQDQFRTSYYQLVAQHREARNQLRRLVPHLDPGVGEHLESLDSTLTDWESRVDEAALLDRSLPAPLFLQRWFESQPVYQKAQQSAVLLDQAIETEIAERREQISEIERVQSMIAIVLTLLALASASAVTWLGHRMRWLASEAEKRRGEAETEAARAQAARRTAELAEERARFLAEASRELSSSLDLRETLGRVAALPVPRLADACLIDLSETDALKPTRITSPLVDIDPDSVQLDLLSMRPGSLIARAMETGRPWTMSEVRSEELRSLTDSDQADTLAAEIGSLIVVPLSVRDRISGAITLLRRHGGENRFEDGFGLAVEFANRVAIAVDNAALYTASQEAVSTRDEILAVVSHDLRNPLTTIQMSASLLEQDAETHELKDELRVIRSTARRMNRLIQDLLDASTLQRGRTLSVEPRRVEVGGLLDDVAELFRHQLGGRDLDIRVDPDLPAVHADRDRLIQVFSNLVGNALKFTADDDTVTFGARRTLSCVEFHVSDSGPGIPEHDLAHVFDPFWQAKSTARLGTGLGLTICRGIVEAHGGEISADSAPGRGTTFRFTIPECS